MSFLQRVHLKKEESTPLYLQLQKVLRDAITDKVLTSANAIPTERELALDFDVSRITVRKAIDGLVNEGLLTRKRGAGTFVPEARVEKSFAVLSSFSEDMRARGRTPSSNWLNRSQGTVTPEESLYLGLSPGSSVFRFHRVRCADEASMALEYATVPGYCLPSVEVVEESLYAALESTGSRPVRALQRFRAVAFTPEQAELLGIEAGAPALFIERRGFLEDGRSAEFTQSYYRGDAYDLMAELTMKR